MTNEQLISILKEHKAAALRGIEAANMTVWEWEGKGAITKEMAQTVTNYLQASVTAVEALTPKIPY